MGGEGEGEGGKDGDGGGAGGNVGGVGDGGAGAKLAWSQAVMAAELPAYESTPPVPEMPVPWSTGAVCSVALAPAACSASYMRSDCRGPM